MSVITVTQFVPRPRAEVFALLNDLGAIARFSPGIESSPVDEGSNPSGVGAERTCHFYDGNHIQERVLEVDDGERLVIDIYKGSMPLTKAIATFNLRDADGGTSVDMTMDYALKFGVLGQLMDAVMVKRQFTGNLTSLLAGLNAHMTTGEVVGKDYFKTHKMVA